eukprot:2662928-Pyramimonas_sp.AAC.1
MRRKERRASRGKGRGVKDEGNTGKGSFALSRHCRAATRFWLNPSHCSSTDPGEGSWGTQGLSNLGTQEPRNIRNPGT